jgi:hypothetical protein
MIDVFYRTFFHPGWITDRKYRHSVTVLNNITLSLHIHSCCRTTLQARRSAGFRPHSLPNPKRTKIRFPPQLAAASRFKWIQWIAREVRPTGISKTMWWTQRCTSWDISLWRSVNVIGVTWDHVASTFGMEWIKQETRTRKRQARLGLEEGSGKLVRIVVWHPSVIDDYDDDDDAGCDRWPYPWLNKNQYWRILYHAVTCHLLNFRS